jgi:DNA-binding winged helix-turn-helix (wHTH) protein/tetratricopeptide (TPR) repeat protein
MKEFDPFRLDVANECLWRDDERIPLTPKAFSLLAFLVERPGALVPQSELIEELWPDTFVQPEVLKTHIRDLRSVLGDDARNPRFIETQHRRGYRFIAKVHDRASSSKRSSAPSAQLVGQESNFSSLLSYFHEACNGNPQLVFVTGEVGIGKTSLVDSLEREILSGPFGAMVLRGQCVEGYGGREAYYPALDAVSNLFRLPGREAYVNIFAEYAPTWLAQFPASLKKEQRKKLREELAGATTGRMLREFCVTIEFIAKESPIVLILEDVHWADPHTVDLFAALARGRWLAKLMIVATCRTVELSLANRPLKLLMENLLAHRLCHQLEVDGLTLRDVQRLLEKKAPNGRVPIGLPEFLYRRSEGNPLFLEAALGQLIANGFLAKEDGGWTVKTPLADIRSVVPETLRQLLGAHIESHLSEFEQTVLEAASVCGVTFTVALAASVAEASQEQVEELCERLSRHGHFIRAAGALDLPGGTVTSQFEFVHSLYQEIFHERIARVRKARLHKLCGLELESTNSGQIELVASQVAYHFEMSQEWERVPKYLFLVAELASRRFAFDDAVQALEHALALMDRLVRPEVEADRVNALYRIAEVYSMTDAVTRAIDALERAMRSPAVFGNNRTKIQILMRMAFLFSRLSGSRCIAAAQEAFQLSLTEDDPYLRAQSRRVFFAWKVFCNAWSSEDVKECVAAVAASAQCPNPVIPAQGEILISVLYFLSSRYREGLVTLRDATPVLAGTGDPIYRVAERFEVWLLLFSGQLGEALKRAYHLAAAHKKDGNRLREHIWKVELAWIHLEALDYAGAIDLCQESISVLSSPDTAWIRCNCISLMGTAEVHLGRLKDARKHLDEVSVFLSASDTWLHWYWKLPLYLAQTELELKSNDVTSARQSAEKFLSAALSTEERTWQALAWDACARVAMRRCDLDQATEYINNAIEITNGFDVPLANWRVHKTAANLIPKEADHHRALARKTIDRLVDALNDVPSLKHCFLTSPEIQDVFLAPKFIE